MSDKVHADMQQGDTERNSLLDMAADHLASIWLKLKYPTPYRAARYVQGYVVEIAVREVRRVDVRQDEDEAIAD